MSAIMSFFSPTASLKSCGSVAGGQPSLLAGLLGSRATRGAMTFLLQAVAGKTNSTRFDLGAPEQYREQLRMSQAAAET